MVKSAMLAVPALGAGGLFFHQGGVFGLMRAVCIIAANFAQMFFSTYAQIGEHTNVDQNTRKPLVEGTESRMRRGMLSGFQYGSRSAEGLNDCGLRSRGKVPGLQRQSAGEAQHS